MLFRYLAAEEDTFLGGEQMLFELLHFDFFNVAPLEIAKMAVEADDLKRKGETSSIRALLKERAHRPPVDLFDTGLDPALVRISDVLEELLLQKLTVPVILEKIIAGFDMSGYAIKHNYVPELSWFSDLIGKAFSMRADQFISFLREERIDWPLPSDLPAPPIYEPLETAFVSKRLGKFVMNVSALNNYLQCPLKFYYQNILRMPSAKSEAMGFGSAIHYAVEKLFEKMKLNPGEWFPPKSEMVEDFKKYMTDSREIFTRESFARKMSHGEITIGNYYDKYIRSWKKIVMIESNIRNVKLLGVPLKGKLDKIEFSGSEVNIVDYKTGNHERALQEMERPNELRPLGGNYWRQAVFYHLLVELRPGKKWIPVSTEFDFIEPDSFGEFLKVKLYIQPSDKETVSQQIVRTWEKIQRHDFYTGCGKEGCRWCSMGSGLVNQGAF
ncbi:MAG: PD-(D/E)XK nuclease family protein [Chitinophagaceae bacterium]